MLWLSWLGIEMECKRSTIGIFTGLFIGLIFGLGQFFFFDESRHIASVILYERILFDEYWEAAPPSLSRAELRRAELSSQSSVGKEQRDVVVAGLLNGWFRLIDGTLFRFAIDEALKSGSISRDIQRYARLNKGYADGLNQRSISFQVVGGDESVVEQELERWVASVQETSTLQAHSAVKSWLSRKASSLEALSEGNGATLSEDAKSEFKRMAAEFHNAADSFPLIEPFQAALSEIEVYSHPRTWAPRMALWALIGAVIGGVLLLGFRAKRAG